MSGLKNSDERPAEVRPERANGDPAGGIDDRRFRKYRRLLLVLMIAVVLFVIGYLVSGFVRSRRGGGATADNAVGRTALKKTFAPAKSIVLAPGVRLDMVEVRAGAFRMSRVDKSNWKDEVEHEAVLTHDFFIGRTEVTQAQWRAVMGTDPSFFKGDSLPVERVSWNDAMAFCARLNATGRAPAGWKFTLPTETQWEFAARGGLADRGCKYSGSDDLREVGWYGDSDGGGRTRPVAARSPNELGIYDMSGNVWEWCLDDYIRDSGKVDPESPRFGHTVRTIRGGCWSKDARYCRVSARYYCDPAFRFAFIGFRVALVKVK